MIRVLIQKAIKDASIPSSDKLKKWARAAISPHQSEAELTIRIVDVAEIKSLNKQFRHQDKPTNVLSFPFESPPGVQLPLLGDIIICAKVVADEAKAAGKSLEAHFAHMVIHGSLHLLGYDHIDSADAIVMEGLEINLLSALSYPNPYVS